MIRRGSPGDQEHNVALLDLMRWVSACLVAVGHIRDLLFLDYTTIGEANLLVKAFYASTGFGREAVMVFFVLSGYLVGGGLVRDGLNRASLFNYFIHRFSRIYIVLLPALAATLLLDVSGSRLLPSLYHQACWASSLDFIVLDRDTLATLACNAANLQDASCTAFGSNGPLWSLAYEWFYYVTFPIVLAAVGEITNRRSSIMRLILYALGFLLLTYLFPTYMSYYPVWLFGVAARVRRFRYDISTRWAYLAAVIASILLAFARAHLMPAFVTDIPFGASLAIFLASARLWTAAGWFAKINTDLAGFSYSLYVTHFPLMVFILALLIRYDVVGRRLMPSPTAFGLFIACGALVYSAAWAFSRGTERQTRRLRLLISGCLARLSPAAMVPDAAFIAAENDPRRPPQDPADHGA